MKLKNILIVFCVLILFECQPNNVSKKSLKQRVNEYYSELIKGEYANLGIFYGKKGEGNGPGLSGLILCMELHCCKR